MISFYYPFKFTHSLIVLGSNYYYLGQPEGSENSTHERNADASAIENMEEQIDCRKKTWQERRERKLI